MPTHCCQQEAYTWKSKPLSLTFYPSPKCNLYYQSAIFPSRPCSTHIPYQRVDTQPDTDMERRNQGGDRDGDRDPSLMPAIPSCSPLDRESEEPTFSISSQPKGHPLHLEHPLGKKIQANMKGWRSPVHRNVEISKTNGRDGFRDTQHDEGSKFSQSLDSCRIFVETGPYAPKHSEWLWGSDDKCAVTGGNHSRQLTIPNTGEALEQMELLNVAGGNENHIDTLEHSLSVL